MLGTAIKNDSSRATSSILRICCPTLTRYRQRLAGTTTAKENVEISVHSVILAEVTCVSSREARNVHSFLDEIKSTTSAKYEVLIKPRVGEF